MKETLRIISDVFREEAPRVAEELFGGSHTPAYLLAGLYAALKRRALVYPLDALAYSLFLSWRAVKDAGTLIAERKIFMVKPVPELVLDTLRRLDIPEAEKAVELFFHARERLLSAWDTGLLAACIYIASGLKYTDIYEKLSVSHVTTRKYVKQVKYILKIAPLTVKTPSIANYLM